MKIAFEMDIWNELRWKIDTIRETNYYIVGRLLRHWKAFYLLKKSIEYFNWLIFINGTA